MKDISRRGALAGFAAVATVAPTVASALTPTGGIGALWERRQAAVERSNLAFAAYEAGVASLPEWARPGPKYLIHTGEYSGQNVRAPLDHRIQPPAEEGRYKLCRVSFRDVRERFADNVRWWPGSREKHRAAMRAHFRRLIPLYRAQAAEYRRARIAELELAQNAAAEAVWEIEGAIRECPASAEQTAAFILQEIILHAHTDSTIESDGSMAVGALALTALQPALSGLLAEHVAAFLRDVQAPLSQHAFVGV